jgi:hypothetical protein
MKPLVFILLFLPPAALFAQNAVKESLFTDNYALKTETGKALALSIENISFLKNIETDGDLMQGYTLPGFRINPRLIYQPSKSVTLEGGITMLKFWGLDKYPNYAYQNMPEWTADNYRTGFHMLPFFRVHIQPVQQINIVFGTLYGGNNHRFIEPLYNPELNMIADPETGVQFLYDSRALHFDTWINWEIFTLKNDIHNEMVNFGVSGSVHVTSPESPFNLDIPIQAIVTHHGGELDTVHVMSTQANFAAGISTRFRTGAKWLSSIGFSLMSAGSFDHDAVQQGRAVYASLTAGIGNLNAKFTLWRSRNFVNLFGSPVFGNLSTAHYGYFFPLNTMYNPGIRYEKQSAPGIYFGADAECFFNPAMHSYSDGSKYLSFNWSTGIYIRINPEIILKR